MLFDPSFPVEILAPSFPKVVEDLDLLPGSVGDSPHYCGLWHVFAITLAMWLRRAQGIVRMFSGHHLQLLWYTGRIQTATRRIQVRPPWLSFLILETCFFWKGNSDRIVLLTKAFD